MPNPVTPRPPRLVIRRLDGIDEIGEAWPGVAPAQLDTPPDCNSTFILFRAAQRYLLYREVAKS